MLRYIAWAWLGICALAGLVLALGLAFLPRAQAPLGPTLTASTGLTALASPAARYLKRIGPRKYPRQIGGSDA